MKKIFAFVFLMMGTEAIGELIASPQRVWRFYPHRGHGRGKSHWEQNWHHQTWQSSFSPWFFHPLFIQFPQPLHAFHICYPSVPLYPPPFQPNVSSVSSKSSEPPQLPPSATEPSQSYQHSQIPQSLRPPQFSGPGQHYLPPEIPLSLRPTESSHSSQSPKVPKEPSSDETSNQTESYELMTIGAGWNANNNSVTSQDLSPTTDPHIDSGQTDVTPTYHGGEGIIGVRIGN